MPTFTKTKTFATNESPIASADLNSIGNDVATFLNTTKLDADNIQSGAITNTQLSSSAAIATSKLATTTPGHVLIGATTTGIPTFTALTGDVTITGGGVTAIGAGKVTNAMLAGSVAYSNLTLTGSIVNADVSSSAAVAVSKLAPGTSAQVLLSNATPTPTWTTLSGDVTVGATGTTAIGAGKVTNTMLADTAMYLNSVTRTTDTGSITSAVDVGDLDSLTITMPTTTRKLKLSFYCSSFTTTGGSTVAQIDIKESSTILQTWKSEVLSTTSDSVSSCNMFVILSGVSAGSHTYKITASRSTGSGSFVMKGSATTPMVYVAEII